MRSDYQARSLHYFHLYAVKDRINLDQCEDQPSAPDISSINLEVLLPTEDDYKTLHRNMSILIARINTFLSLPSMAWELSDTSDTGSLKRCPKNQQW